MYYIKGKYPKTVIEKSIEFRVMEQEKHQITDLVGVGACQTLDSSSMLLRRTV